jgi:hypothetical protein
VELMCGRGHYRRRSGRQARQAASRGSHVPALGKVARQVWTPGNMRVNDWRPADELGFCVASG